MLSGASHLADADSLWMWMCGHVLPSFGQRTHPAGPYVNDDGQFSAACLQAFLHDTVLKLPEVSPPPCARHVKGLAGSFLPGPSRGARS